MNKSILGNNIKAARKAKKMTQKELATKIGKTESSIRKYEKGFCDIPNSVIEAIAKSLDVSVFEITNGIYPSEPKNVAEYLNMGEKIHQLRKQAGLTQKELAEKVGVSDTAIMRYEKNQRIPRKETLNKLAAVLNTTPSDLMGFMDEWERLYNSDGRLALESELLSKIADLYGADAAKLLELFNELNELGKKNALEHLEDLTNLPKYSK